VQRFISIDNVCAWPNLTLLDDGTLISVVYNQPVHGAWEGDVDCWASSDGGHLWERRSTITAHEPGTVRMNHAVGVAANGDLVVGCSGWTDRYPPGTPHDQMTRTFAESTVLPPVVLRSGDQGRTWQQTNSMPNGIAGLSEHVPFGDILRSAEGSLCMGTYSFSFQTKKGNCYLVRSNDDGQTWGDAAPIVEDRHVEAAVLHVGDGVWLSAVRVFGTLELDLFESTDDGHNWQFKKNLGVPAVSSAHLLKLADGRTLLTYGNRMPNSRGIDMRLSEDGGATWTAPNRLIHLPPHGDCGYPAAVQFPDGRIVIVYYVARIEGHDRYHMGTLLFENDEI